MVAVPVSHLMIPLTIELVYRSMDLSYSMHSHGSQSDSLAAKWPRAAIASIFSTVLIWSLRCAGFRAFFVGLDHVPRSQPPIILVSQ